LAPVTDPCNANQATNAASQLAKICIKVYINIFGKTFCQAVYGWPSG